MEPPGVPEETLIKAKTMRAELLIQTNKATDNQTVKICHNINLSIHTSLSQTHNIHVHLHMQRVATSDVLNTVKCINPNTDILQQLDEIIHGEIKQLHDYTVHTLEVNKLCATYLDRLHTLLKIERKVVLHYSGNPCTCKKYGGSRVAIYKDVTHGLNTYTCHTPIYWIGLV